MTILSATLLLLLVLDPVGNIPFFLTALNRVRPERRRWVMIRELLVALGALVVFLFAGTRILGVLRIEQPSLSVAGGIILFLIALKMTFPDGRARGDDDIEGEPFIVPLAIPFVAGPSALATVLLIMNQEPDRWPEWLTAVVAAWVVTGAVLFLSEPLGRILGQRGLIAVERLMGMVLTAIAVQMLMDGLRQFLSKAA
jgi:multiple antibiotic resistance protein